MASIRIGGLHRGTYKGVIKRGMYLSTGGDNSGASSFIETFFLGGAVGGGGGGGAAAAALAAAEKQYFFYFCKFFLWDRTSICWYRFAVSGDVLTNLLALQH